MKKFLIRLLLFSLPLLIVSFAADDVVSNYLRKTDKNGRGEYSVWNDIYQGKINSDVVIYGSSRAWVQIDPEIISQSFKVKVYNLGIDGHNIVLEYFRHKMLLRYNHQPKVVIFSVDHNTFGNLDNLYNSDQFLPYMLFDNNIWQATKNFNGFHFLDFYVPFYRYIGRDKIINSAVESVFKTEVENRYRIKGYKGMNLEWNSDFENAKRELGSYKVQFDSASISLFNNYLSECKKYGINNIIVYTPEYIEGQKFTKNMAEMLDSFRVIAAKYNLPFYDYSKDSISFHKRYFYNSEHLNRTGSELFTEEFVKQLKKDGYVSSILRNK